jgi:hypothetical protein
MSKWLPLMPIKRTYYERFDCGGKDRAVAKIEGARARQRLLADYEARGLGSSSIIIRISAIRKLGSPSDDPLRQCWFLQACLKLGCFQRRSHRFHGRRLTSFELASALSHSLRITA